MRSPSATKVTTGAIARHRQAEHHDDEIEKFEGAFEEAHAPWQDGPSDLFSGRRRGGSDITALRQIQGKRASDLERDYGEEAPSTDPTVDPFSVREQANDGTCSRPRANAHGGFATDTRSRMGLARQGGDSAEETLVFLTRLTDWLPTHKVARWFFYTVSWFSF
jgi:hypothetical protein